MRRDWLTVVVVIAGAVMMYGVLVWLVPGGFVG